MASQTKLQLPAETDILIAGAGPTGLLLGILLAKAGIPFQMVEPRAEVSQHSRSIGIHPPSLQLFQEVGLSDAFLEAGNQIRVGRAYVNHDAIGTIPFTRLPNSFPFILTLSQQVTEEILERALLSLAPEQLHRGLGFADFTKEKNRLQVKLTDGSEIRCRYLIGCDGKNSLVREKAGIPFLGGSYPDHYIMGDFDDNLGSREEARVYLCEDGLVESFPHGKNLRRWVIKTRDAVSAPDAQLIAGLALERTGTSPDAATNSMLSTFGVQRMMAESFVKGRVILAGDAAHVVSPIGGQGMNLGWFDAKLLAGLLPDVLRPHKPLPRLLNSYEYRRRNAAYTAAERAEFNLRMGRSFSQRAVFFNKIMVRLLLLPPLRSILLRKFTMDGLD
ncbi:2-polyprenyl-6-methoxyphenol hydroxylase [Cyclonatronum proteinivorum]|uniref:2-polyprenyl-6-methoxyphenol hydroxylase n=1 Tax=Cyclonatronum proteinivorum TaxID=1457365 RepID=A0A345UIG9_9BACT|nr:NAD(P)/FAD-dependent oxidoreductase [Cyclonatronum proteinivorum]AXJ00271.1 2-polyprenyl-6-methoxyphenol hydroxylase [Cyclonatronum proteinivorum]